jgi:hypothetical protein
MSFKTLGFSLVALFVVALAAYGGIWLWSQQMVAEREADDKDKACPKLVIRGKELDTEKIYLALEESQYLSGNPESLTLENKNLDLKVTMSEEELNLVSQRSVWQLNNQEQENLGEIIASTSGITISGEPEFLGLIQTNLSQAENVTIENGDRTLNLSFQCL